MRYYLYYIYYKKDCLIGSNSNLCTTYTRLGLYYKLAFLEAKLYYI